MHQEINHGIRERSAVEHLIVLLRDSVVIFDHRRSLDARFVEPSFEDRRLSQRQ